MKQNLEETKEKNKFFKNKKNIAILVLSILLFISMLSSSETTVEKSNNLTSVLTEKEQIIVENQNQIEKLQDENKTINEEKQNFENEKVILQEENKMLRSEVNSLQEEVNQLKQTVSKQNSTSKTNDSSQNTKKLITTQDTTLTIVYITKTGEKYHKSGCSYLKKSKIQINLSDAKAQGYTACSRCY